MGATTTTAYETTVSDTAVTYANYNDGYALYEEVEYLNPPLWEEDIRSINDVKISHKNFKQQNKFNLKQPMSRSGFKREQRCK